jgi:hypothetical protein
VPTNAGRRRNGSVEIWLEPGGDFVQTDNGDLLLAINTPQSADATNQRLTRLLSTNPRLIGDNGRPISAPDDLFNEDWGAGEPAMIDQPMTPAFVAGLQARVMAAVLSDPTIAPTPAPQIDVSQISDTTAGDFITATTIDGSPVVVPSLPL